MATFLTNCLNSLRFLVRYFQARRHHELGNELKEIGAQLRLEQAKKDKLIKVRT